MKLLKVSILLIGSSLVFSSGALAGDPNKGKLHLQDKTIVDGKALNPGNYTVEWTGNPTDRRSKSLFCTESRPWPLSPLT